jgi:cobalamin synthase
VIALFLVTSIVASIIVVFFTKKIGGITGDILGAINEISEILCLILLKIIS